MILTDCVVVHISNNGKFYRDKGYGPCKQGEVITCKIEDLPTQSNKVVKASCDECNDIFHRSLQILRKNKTLYTNMDLCTNCARRVVIEKRDTKNISLSNSRRTKENHPRWNPNKSQFEEYKAKVHSLTRLTYNNHSLIINPENKKRGLCGEEGAYQLDHMFSIKDGFDNNIPPELLALVDNLQIIPWRENRSKWSKSSTRINNTNKSSKETT